MIKEKGVLKGIRAIDFGQYISGPMAAMILGDYGADVIHIDPPGGPVWNDWQANAILMRGKRNICLDLKNESDRNIAVRLVKTADILIENFRPGVMDRLGLGYEAMHEINPSLVYCSLPGFSADDDRAGLRGWEGIVSAEAGLYEIFAGLGKNIQRFNALCLASVFSAAIGCHSIASALLVREKCGLGQRIEVPMYDACFEAKGIQGSSPGITRPRPEGNMKRSGYELFGFVIKKYPCKDGRYIQITPPPRGLRNAVSALFPESLLYCDEFSPEQHKFFADLMASRTALEWEIYLQEEHGAGAVSALTSSEWLNDRSAIDSRCVIDVHDPVLGDTRQPGVPSLMLIDGDSANLPRTLPDSDRESILSELDSINERRFPEINGKKPEPALNGIKVLDFGQVLAGPIGGRLMAEYGAEVLKINNPRTYENTTAMVGHETVNNGKKTIYLDMKSDEGKTILHELIRESDVFHCNFSQVAYTHLGITEEELRKINPNIILSQVNLHSLGGWREAFRGHEDLGEAVTGLACRYGGSIIPETIPILVCDNLTGQFACLGVLLAVYSRMKTGHAQRVQACLSRTATIAQVPYMLSYKDKVWNEPSGPHAQGWSRFNRLYNTADGTIFLYAEDSAPSLNRVKGLEYVDVTDPYIENELERCFVLHGTDEWVERLTEAGLEARRCRRFSSQVMEEPYARARGLSRTSIHKGIGIMRVASSSPRLSLTPTIPGFAVAACGSDTESFLKEFKASHNIQ